MSARRVAVVGEEARMTFRAGCGSWACLGGQVREVRTDVSLAGGFACSLLRLLGTGLGESQAVADRWRLS